MPTCAREIIYCACSLKIADVCVSHDTIISETFQPSPSTLPDTDIVRANSSFKQRLYRSVHLVDILEAS
jgi:hypothetical protein